MPPPLWLSIGLTLYLSTTTLRLAGFGGALVAMPLLTPLVGITTAAPLMTAFGITNMSVAVAQLWRRVTLADVWRMTLAMAIFVPIGVASADFLPEQTLRLLLGISCVLFAIYRLLNFPIPALVHPRWGYLFGTLGGFLGGAINVGGVPPVVYAESQGWEPDRFRVNLFSFFFIGAIISVISRAVAGQFTQAVGIHWLQTIPFLLAGHLTGSALAVRVNRDQFSKLVLMLVLVMGARIIWSVLTA